MFFVFISRRTGTVRFLLAMNGGQAYVTNDLHRSGTSLNESQPVPYRGQSPEACFKWFFFPQQ